MDLAEEKASKMSIKIDAKTESTESLKKMLKIVGFSEGAMTEESSELVMELA